MELVLNKSESIDEMLIKVLHESHVALRQFPNSMKTIMISIGLLMDDFGGFIPPTEFRGIKVKTIDNSPDIYRIIYFADRNLIGDVMSPKWVHDELFTIATIE